MLKAMYTAGTGMTAQQLNIDNIANNLANVSTNGFKTGEASFQELVYLNLCDPKGYAYQGQQLPEGLQIGSGAMVNSITKIFTQGNLVNTGNPLDIAIQGDGFIQVTLLDGEFRYTRDGSLRLNANGNLVNTNGFLISPQITIPITAISVSIASDGTVSIVNAGATNTSSILGQLVLARFVNEAGLSAEGMNLYSATASSGTPILATPGLNGIGLIQQGFLEQSNVNVVTELVNLIIAQRAYEFNTRVITVCDNQLDLTAQLIHA
jgi:flagellar basal-body rod protein FlgG